MNKAKKVTIRSTTLSDSGLSHDYTLILERCIEFVEDKPKQYVENFLQGQQGEFVYKVRRNHMNWRILKVFMKNLCGSSRMLRIKEDVE